MKKILVVVLVALLVMGLAAPVLANAYPHMNILKYTKTSLTRTYDWGIEKSADVTTLTLLPGQTHQLNYEITVSNTFISTDLPCLGAFRWVTVWATLSLSSVSRISSKELTWIAVRTSP